MKKFFKNVNNLKELKEQYRTLLKENHPDNGGDPEIMKEINIQYDAIFPIWKNRQEKATGETVNETANSTRSQFYTEFGWEGKNHDWNRSLKEIAQIVRTYIKEKYPTYKFSVRTSYASMCQDLSVVLTQSPVEIYKPFDDFTGEDIVEVARRLYPFNDRERLDFLNASRDEQRKIFDASTDAYKKIINDVTRSVVQDVDNFVASYNYEDIDGSIDYCRVDFYYSSCLRNNGNGVKVVPKTARIKNKAAGVEKATNNGKAEKSENGAKLEAPAQYTYKIAKGEDTRDGSILWVVRIVESLDKASYIAENKRMKARGGHYSRFKKGFIFREDPTEILTGKPA